MGELNERESSQNEAARLRLESITEAASVVSDLGALQRQWLIRYLLHGNATLAATEVGYKNPNKIGPRLRRSPKIKAAIDDYFFQDEMGAREVIALLSQHARGTMEDFIHFATDKDGRDILGVEPELSLLKARRRGKLHLIKKFKKKRTVFTDKDGGETVNEWTEVELHDPQAAAVHLGRVHGLFTDKTDLTTGGEKLNVVIAYADSNDNPT